MKRDLFQCVSKFKRDIPIQFSAFFRSHSLSLPNRKNSVRTHMLNAFIRNVCVQGSSTRTKRNECRATCIERKAEENSDKQYSRANGMIRENSTSNTYLNE